MSIIDHRFPQHETLPNAERLVGLGFRYWMLGRRTGEIGHWERTWSLYSGMFGLCGARLAVGSLSCWVNSLGKSSRRQIDLCPVDCGEFSRDECLAVSMVAACQHDTCPAIRACAFALIETSLIDRVVDDARTFADTLSGLEQRLSPISILPAPIRVDATSSVH